MLQVLNVLVDTERMKKNRPRPTVLALSQHWRIVDGVIYRDCTVRTATGEVRVMGVRDELLQGVA